MVGGTKICSLLKGAGAWVLALGIVVASAAAWLGVVESASGRLVLQKARVPARLKAAAPGEGEPWYGGKPTLSVRVESTIEGEIPAGEWVPVRVSILTDLECATVSSRLRAIDALEVLSSDQLESCRADGPILHEARVRLLDGGSGMVAVDLEISTEEGRRVVTRAIPFHAQSRFSDPGE